MTSSKENAFQSILELKGCKRITKDIQESFTILKKVSADEGLASDYLDHLADFLRATKLTSAIYLDVLNCLIPQTKISKECLDKILLWFFNEVGQNKIACAVEKQFLQWLTGIVYYELADSSAVDSFYYSFLFLLNRPSIQNSVCKLLCLLSKPEDGKRWVVQQILQIQNVSGPKSYTNALLSLLKSYKPEVVPEKVPVTNFSYGNFGNLDESFRNAHRRNLSIMTQNNSILKKNELKWDSWRIFESNKMVPRLIPAPEIVNYNSGIKHNAKKLYCVTDLKTMSSVGIHQFNIEYPAQILSLLANVAGYHILAFSDMDIKTRFCQKLYHTLCKVFLLEIVPYSDKEKSYFLNSIKGFQEYIHQSIPVMRTFLFNYLLVWNGNDFLQEILGLIEWIDLRNDDDLQKYLFPCLRQIFISSGTHTKCLIIKTMGKLLRNLLVTDKREINFFQNYYEEFDLVKSVEVISSFVSELINNGLVWNKEKHSRNLLMTAIDFYELTQGIEEAGDLPTIIVMPPSVVYGCLFSGSRLCIARLCALLTRLQVISVERLFLLGVFQDFSDDVQKLNIYMLDYYRCLWNTVSFRKEEDSFIFHNNIFSEMFWEFKNLHGGLVDKIFDIQYNSTFWFPQANGVGDIILKQTTDEYPSLLLLKKVTEERLLQ